MNNIAPIPDKKNTLIDAIKAKRQLIETLMKQRRKMEEKIKLPEIPNDKQYNKLKTGSRLFINIIKMICYRAETAPANEIQYFSRADDEKKMLIKQIIQTPVNIMPDFKNKTLTETLHTLYTPGYNEIATTIAKLLNDTETILPGTHLTLILKTQ